MPNRLFYTVKMNSDYLNAFKYDVNISIFKKKNKNDIICLDAGDGISIISLADTQVLKSIRDITNKVINRDLLEEWYKERDRLKRKKNIIKEEREKVKELQDNIYTMMYIPEYITVQMNNSRHYEKMYKDGFYFNGEHYRRFSCSASQARVSTVVFVTEDIKEELKRRLDNGRDLEHLLAPTKYNAYFGLYSSATKAVTKPRFCIVSDYCETQPVDVNYVTEMGENEDDIVEPKTIDVEFNRFDGSGLISPQMAEQWGKDLGEDYTPCNFCLRYAFTKGMVNEFDFVNWCEEKNDGNYKIQDVWGNWIDLREIDVILSEGQVKLWDSWKSQEDFERCCKDNGIIFGITKYSPKKDVEASTTNYQFLQTLDLDNDQVKELCKDTVDYIKGVSYEDVYYTLLFLLGEGMTEDKVKQYMQESDNYWLKTLILNHNLLNDKYTKEKIRDFVVRKIEQACLGKLIVNGNFECICPDPYAYMEWITGQEVKGLLNPHEAYCDFWNRKGITKVDALRSPLTHFSEHGIDELKNTDDMQKWYKYCYSGYISNVHDEFTMIHAGSDFDYDIIFSTNNRQFLDGAYKNQRVVTYAAKKPKKKPFTEDDLYVADTFSFGTRIGQMNF